MTRYLARGRPFLERRPRPELFLNARGGALTRAGAFLILRRLAEVAGLKRAHPPAPFAPLLCHPPTGRRRRPTQRPGDARPRRSLDHRAVHPRLRQAPARDLLQRAPARQNEGALEEPLSASAGERLALRLSRRRRFLPSCTCLQGLVSSTMPASMPSVSDWGEPLRRQTTASRGTARCRRDWPGCAGWSERSCSTAPGSGAAREQLQRDQRRAATAQLSSSKPRFEKLELLAKAKLPDRAIGFFFSGFCVFTGSAYCWHISRPTDLERLRLQRQRLPIALSERPMLR